MKKLWLLVDTHHFEMQDIQLDEPRRRVPEPRTQPVRDNRLRVNPNERPISCQIFGSRTELEEIATILLRQNSSLKYMIFECTGVMETIPTDPICKKFNENGELIL